MQAFYSMAKVSVGCIRIGKTEKKGKLFSLFGIT